MITKATDAGLHLYEQRLDQDWGFAVEKAGVRVLNLPRLIELKLASGMTGGVTRLKDFADLVALIETLDLPAEFAEQLDEYVRAKFMELCDGVRSAPSRSDTE